MKAVRIGHLYLCGAAICALVPSVPAWAQTASAAEDTDSSGQIGEIIVTANRREQKLQEVPIAISAITTEAAEAKGITGIANLQTAVPGLQITRQANQAQPYLRGLGAASGSPNAEPSVALYVDGVYNPSANANFFDFNNVERIEVLKGPQGTLFGRNATGGVIQIITKDPGDSVEGSVSLGYANYDTITANAYLSAPLSENLGANIAVMFKDQGDGWGKNLFTGKDTRPNKDLGLRGKIVWSNGSTTIKLAGDYSHNRGGAINGQVVAPSRAVNFPVILATGVGDPFPGKFNVNNNFEQISDVETGGVSLTAMHDTGGVVLESISAYRKTKGFWTLDQDLSPWQGLDAIPNQSARMYSQEFHVSSAKSSTLQWLLGAYYYNYDAAAAPQALNGILLDPTFPGCLFTNTCNGQSGVDISAGTKATSFSLFGQATYPLGESTNLTVGARYTWEKVAYRGMTTFHNTNIPVPGIGGPLTAEKKDNSPTFRVSLDHKITPEVMVYASYNKGRKSSGYEVSGFVIPVVASSPYDAEKLNAFELGIKSDLFDRRVRFNVGGFYYDFKNMQFQKISSGNAVTFNAPNGATMYGIEADLEARVTENLDLSANLGYLHTSIRDFLGAPNTCLNVVSGLSDAGGFFCNGANGSPDPANLLPFNAKGNNTPNSPEFSANFGAVYSIPTSVGTFALAGNAYYTSKMYFEIDNRTNNPAKWLLNASLLWKDNSKKMSLRIWGRNLSNEYYYTQYTGQGNASDIGSPGNPREYGVTLGYTF